MIRNRTLLIACGALAHELVSLKKLNHWEALDIQCLPAEYHNSPQKIVPAIRALLDKKISHYEHCMIAYADCGTGGELDRLVEEFGIERLPGAHCYEFYAGSSRFEAFAEAELGTFYLTNFLVRHFERIVMRDLGLNKHPELLELYFGHYKKLLFLDQSGAPEHQELAQQAAKKLGLEYEYCFTGLREVEIPLKDFWQNRKVSVEQIFSAKSA